MEDTICAISTPLGEGGIGIVRISGPDAANIAARLFKPVRKNSSFVKEGRKLIFGHIIDGEEVLDEVLLSYHPRPYTYTREDIVEINCHGGIIPLKRILQLAIEKGARVAEPGEFTKRAFLNGRIDLTQAEAVMDLIVSRTERSAAAAVRQMAGGLKQKIESMRKKVLEILVEMEALFDYPEEDIDIELESIPPRMRKIKEALQHLIAAGERGRIIREGVNIVIAGRPNAGKSSLLNHLLGKKRAIVSDIPGTTRDVLEEDINIAGVPIRLVDTAGIRETGNIIEMEGVKLAREKAEQADLILHIVDGSIPLSNEDKAMAQLKQKGLTIINKADLPVVVSEDEVKALLPQRQEVTVSLKTGKNLDLMESKLESILLGEKGIEAEPPLVTNIRHLQNLKLADEGLSNSLQAIKEGMPLEIAAIDLREALEALGRITGEGSPMEIVHQVFERFCVGK